MNYNLHNIISFEIEDKSTIHSFFEKEFHDFSSKNKCIKNHIVFNEIHI